MNFLGSKNNRNKLTRFFITFPKSKNITPENFLSFLPPTRYKIYCKELHKDGTPHLHISCQLQTATSKAQLLKIYKEAYPIDYKRIHIQPTRNMSASIDYVKKDGTYKEEGTYDLGGGQKIRKKKMSQDKYRKIMEEIIYQWSQEDFQPQNIN